MDWGSRAFIIHNASFTHIKRIFHILFLLFQIIFRFINALKLVAEAKFTIPPTIFILLLSDFTRLRMARAD